VGQFCRKSVAAGCFYPDHASEEEHAGDQQGQDGVAARVVMQVDGSIEVPGRGANEPNPLFQREHPVLLPFCQLAPRVR